MEIVRMKDSGDGYRRADDGSYGKGPFAKTASFTLAKVDAGKVFTNRAAAGTVVATLPAATKGLWFAFAAPTAQTFTLTATGGAKIDGGGANGSVNVPATGSVRLFSDGTDWFTSPSSSLPQGTDGQLLVGQTGSAPAYETVSGDATLAANGALTIGAAKITKAKTKSYYTSQATGNGSPQNVAHGLGVDPAVVLVIPTDGGTVTYTHDSTNVVVACTNAKRYDVLAIA